MNKEEAKKIIQEEFKNNIMENFDSSLIFTYISNLEKENKQLKDNWNKLKEIINTSRVSKGIFFDDGDVLIAIKNMIDKIESGDSE